LPDRRRTADERDQRAGRPEGTQRHGQAFRLATSRVVNEIFLCRSAVMRTLVLVTVALIGYSASAVAQTQRIGPGGVPMAPGPSQPRDFTPGGIGAGGVPVAPGPAARDVNVERIGPGGGALAPGPAGNVGTGPTPRTPAVAPSSRDLSGTVQAKRRHFHRGKKLRPRIVRSSGKRM
jgi:hypothetical protein